MVPTAITQFLSRGINDRTDDYGGSGENRTRCVLEIVRTMRREVGCDFHLQIKIDAVDHNDLLYPWKKQGNRLEQTKKICTMLPEGKASMPSPDRQRAAGFCTNTWTRRLLSRPSEV